MFGQTETNSVFFQSLGSIIAMNHSCVVKTKSLVTLKSRLSIRPIVMPQQ